MTDFDTILNSLHDNGMLTDDQPEDDLIRIDTNRKFVVPKGFEKTVAYVGDVNSQIITFVCPRYADNHDLFLCDNKRLRWINSSSKLDGSSILDWELNPKNDSELLLKWKMPAEAFTQAGKLQISISIFDFAAGTNQVAFSWNTAALSDLEVGSSLDTVAWKIDQQAINSYIPAKDEILNINPETRIISAPRGYQNMICNYGDVDTTVVYFQTKRYIRGIDLLDEGTSFRLYWQLKTLQNVDDSVGKNDNENKKQLYAVALTDRDSEGLVNIIWKPNSILTANGLRTTGQLKIQLEIISDGKVWRTSPYEGLKIGDSPFAYEYGDLPGIEPETPAELAMYFLDGTAYDQEAMKKVVVPGLSQLRTFTSGSPTWIYRNELMMEVNKNGEYVGIKIGTDPNGEDVRRAPYVAYAPNTIIVFDGGNANGPKEEA